MVRKKSLILDSDSKLRILTRKGIIEISDSRKNRSITIKKRRK